MLLLLLLLTLLPTHSCKTHCGSGPQLFGNTKELQSYTKESHLLPFTSRLCIKAYGINTLPSSRVKTSLTFFFSSSKVLNPSSFTYSCNWPSTPLFWISGLGHTSLSKLTFSTSRLKKAVSQLELGQEALQQAKLSHRCKRCFNSYQKT